MKLEKIENEVFEINSSEDLVRFIVNVECDNSDKISEIVRSNVDLFYDLYSTLKNLQNISDESFDVDIVRELILELHQKLLEIKKHYDDFDKCLDVVSDDSKLMYNSLQ